MTGLKKILLTILVLCTLGYGSAWAYDDHAVELGDEHPVSFDASSVLNDDNFDASPSSEQASNADLACDHSCHIFAHLQAIFTQTRSLDSVNQSSELFEFFEMSVSYIVSPDIKPPRV